MATKPTTVKDVADVVDLDLDAVEKPEEAQIPPFTVRIGGRKITMTDPADLDWQDLADITDPTEFIRYCVSQEDRRHILNQDIEGWRFGKLMEGYMLHYHLDEKVEKAQRANRRAGR